MLLIAFFVHTIALPGLDLQLEGKFLFLQSMYIRTFLLHACAYWLNGRDKAQNLFLSTLLPQRSPIYHHFTKIFPFR